MTHSYSFLNLPIIMIDLKTRNQYMVKKIDNQWGTSILLNGDRAGETFDMFLDDLVLFNGYLTEENITLINYHIQRDKEIELEQEQEQNENFLTDNRFWEIVNIINWGLDTDYNKASDRFMEALDNGTVSSKEVILFLEKRNHFYSMLDNKIEELTASEYGEKIDLGDDSLSDLINHFIGLGESDFKQALENIEIISERALNQNFVESFSYALSDTFDKAEAIIKESETK